MDFLSCVLLCLMVAWIVIQALQYSFARRIPTNLPPGPNPFPLIGNLLELGNKPHISLTKLSKRYGPIMTLQLGQITTVVVSSSAVAKQVLRTHDQFFCNRTIPDAVQAYKHAKYAMPWLTVSPTWRNLRKICNSQLFAAKVLDANQANRHLKVQELIADVKESVVKGKAVEVGRAAFKTTLNLMSRTVFSVDLADQNSERAREFKELVWSIMEEAGKPNLADYFPVLKKIDPMGIRRRLGKHFQKMIDLFDRMIVQRLESRKSRDYDLFGAGTETTSATLEWAMAELLRNPEKLSKAQEELKQVVGKGKPVEESDITRLPYLQAIIKETFRLHPVVPLLLPRRAQADIEICGYIVPKGAQVLVNAWAIGRDPTIWDNPTSFIPERFLGLDIDVTGQNFELIPFGGGRRICPGLPLAMRMLNLMLGSLINSFDNWKLEDGVVPEKMNMDEKFGLTLQMAHPVIAVPVKY
ncbi:PREDICTED: geraniol [Prunus dulcis]|uniref:PREDICTED: geraniol n=1 Tax=Prunus dulcis TaxID=3755 RepID=A0A5E4G8U1_PRUDU|nr:PREDICTED: geraniol [Prunus dulcis]